MHSSPHIVSNHRLVAWARLALAWAAMILFAENAPQQPRRRLIQRHPLLSPDAWARFVRNLVIIRAAQIARGSAGCAAPPRVFAPRGFKRRMRPRQLVRSSAGAWLRRALRDRDRARRFMRLLEALRDLDSLAVRLARRLVRRLTRLRPIIATRPPHVRVASLAAPAPFVSDSS